VVRLNKGVAQMKLSFLLGAAIGYVLGARAGREKYESIVKFGRQVVGSQTVQSSAGVLQAQVDELRHRAAGAVSNKLRPAQDGSTTMTAAGPMATDGYRAEG
jgi:hypothetical protein